MGEIAGQISANAPRQPWSVKGMSSRPILVVEDDHDVAAIICCALRHEGWATQHAATLEEAFAMLRQHDPCIAIIDLALPDGSGMNLVRAASARTNTGVIVVSGHGDEVDRLIGLEVGADDYLGKPFSQRELMARVRALYRRLDCHQEIAAVQPPQRGASVPPMLQLGDITLDPMRLRVTGPNGMTLALTGGEADLLARLIEAGGELVAREAVSESILGHRLQPEQRGIDRLASNLRHKLEAVPGSTVRITAVRGKGYRLIC